MNGEYRCGNLQYFVLTRTNKADWIGESRVRLLHARALSHSAAREYGEPDNLPVLGVRNKPDVVGVDVGRVVAFVGKSDFEFARQIGGPVHRLHFPRISLLGRLNLAAFSPSTQIS